MLFFFSLFSLPIVSILILLELLSKLENFMGEDAEECGLDGSGLRNTRNPEDG